MIMVVMVVVIMVVTEETGNSERLDGERQIDDDG